MDNNPKKRANKWLALINIPIQMGAIIFAFSYLGNWLDENHPHPRVYYNKILVCRRGLGFVQCDSSGKWNE
jgi:hypothetical protein